MRAWLVVVLSVIVSTAASAIDNPDAPNPVELFQERIFAWEEAIEEAETTRDFAEVFAEFETELDRELNTAYQALMKALPETARAKMRLAQRRWIAHRDAEFEFIGASITNESFGSSAVISRGAFRTGLLKARVVDLLSYPRQF